MLWIYKEFGISEVSLWKMMFKSSLPNARENIIFTFTIYFEMIYFNFEILCSDEHNRYLSIHF